MSISLNVSAPLAIRNVTDLKAWIADEVDRDLADITDKLDKWILLAETRFHRDLRCPEMERTVLITATGEDTQLPSDYVAMRALYEKGSPDSPLQPLAPAQQREFYDGTAGQPYAFTLVSGVIRLIPVPDQPYTLSLDYYASVPNLSVMEPSNWLLEKHPDLYIAGVLFNYYRWVPDMELAAAANALCEQLIAKINQAARLDRYGAGSLARSTCSQSRSGRC